MTDFWDKTEQTCIAFWNKCELQVSCSKAKQTKPKSQSANHGFTQNKYTERRSATTKSMFPQFAEPTPSVLWTKRCLRVGEGSMGSTFGLILETEFWFLWKQPQKRGGDSQPFFDPCFL